MAVKEQVWGQKLSFMSCIFMPYLTLAAIQYELVK